MKNDANNVIEVMMTLARLDSTLSIQGMVTLSELRKRLYAKFGARPHYYRSSARRGGTG